MQQGFCVVTFDNRDAGQSYCHQPYAKPNLTRFAVKKRLGFTVKPPDSLTDMANDIIELLDKLALSEVNVVGVSMGGMIAQLMAIHYPHRVLSLTLMMTTSGDKMLPKSHPKLLKHIRTIVRANSVAKQRQYYHKVLSMISSPGFKEPVSKTTAQVNALVDYGINVAGTLRQMMAILCAESRVEGLLRIQAPTLIIHGDSDALIPHQGGEHLAHIITHAEFWLIHGMGHNLPELLALKITQRISNHVLQKADIKQNKESFLLESY